MVEEECRCVKAVKRSFVKPKETISIEPVKCPFFCCCRFASTGPNRIIPIILTNIIICVRMWPPPLVGCIKTFYVFHCVKVKLQKYAWNYNVTFKFLTIDVSSLSNARFAAWCPMLCVCWSCCLLLWALNSSIISQKMCKKTFYLGQKRWMLDMHKNSIIYYFIVFKYFFEIYTSGTRLMKNTKTMKGETTLK